MSDSKKTTKIRIYKSMYNELKTKFPEVRHPDLLAIIYNTSAVKIEGLLRKPKRPKKEF